jgi:2-methylcitrate dehydratase
MSWADIEEKFERLTADRYDAERRSEIVETVKALEEHTVADLVALLE